VLGDDQISVVGGRLICSAPSPLDESENIEENSRVLARGARRPVMSARVRWHLFAQCWHSDLRAFRLAGDVDDVRAHGKDERVAVKSFREGSEYLYRLVKRLSGGN